MTSEAIIGKCPRCRNPILEKEPTITADGYAWHVWCWKAKEWEESPDWYPDCGDNSCLFVPKEHRGGMRTNGGCRCMPHMKSHDRLKAQKIAMYWKKKAGE